MRYRTMHIEPFGSLYLWRQKRKEQWIKHEGLATDYTYLRRAAKKALQEIDAREPLPQIETARGLLAHALAETQEEP